MRHLLPFLALALALTGCPASTRTAFSNPAPEDVPAWSTHNAVYQDLPIRTIQTYRENEPFSYPFLFLKDPGVLVLEFDWLMPQDLTPEDLYVGISACDADWSLSSLLPMEYLDGYTSERIIDWRRSVNTRIPYVHFKYRLDPANIRFKRSGNYLLRVWRGNNEDDVVLTQRMMVAERRVGLEVLSAQSQAGTLRNRFQRIEFNIYPGSIPLVDPRMELEVVVLQNGRWDNAARGLQPTFFGPDQYQYLFNAGEHFSWSQEFRRFDDRSTRFRGQHLAGIHDLDTIWQVELQPDKPRKNTDYVALNDFNGDYAIGVQEMANPDVSSDYVLVKFSLQGITPEEGTELAVTGRLTNWGLDPQSILVFDPARKEYTTEILLKQGFYDYAYTQTPPGGNPDERTLEGFWPNTENTYTILVYYKPIQSRCAELVGMSHLNYGFF